MTRNGRSKSISIRGRYDLEGANVVKRGLRHLAGPSVLGKITKPAIVLDIDETSLSNWRQMADQHGWDAYR